MAARCEVCGKEDDKPLHILTNGVFHTYDCFECAIQALAPLCHSCGNRIIGHGVEAYGFLFCSADCARKARPVPSADRSRHPSAT